MKRIDEIITIIAEGFRADVEFDGFENLREYFKTMQFGSEDYAEEFKAILDEAKAFEKYDYTDEMEVLEDNKIYSLKDVIRMVKAYKF